MPTTIACAYIKAEREQCFFLYISVLSANKQKQRSTSKEKMQRGGGGGGGSGRWLAHKWRSHPRLNKGLGVSR